jgi:hypothetical protein
MPLLKIKTTMTCIFSYSGANKKMRDRKKEIKREREKEGMGGRE